MFRPTIPSTWLDLGFDIWSLGLDSASVVALRLAKLSQGGPSAAHEAQRMVMEKAESLVHVHFATLTGAMGRSTEAFADNLTRHLSSKVQANKRRLSREARG